MSKKHNRAAEILQAQQQATAFAHEWLSNNRVLPEGVDADEDQFAAVMNTVLRALMQAYAQGYTDRGTP